MTRHELKEQLQHDAFRENVGSAVGYVSTHRRQALRIVVILAVVAAIAGISYAVYRLQLNKREQALNGAMDLAEATVGTQPDAIGRSFPTQQAKDAATMKAFSDVAANYNGTEQGDVAQYYLAGLQAATGKYADAERNFKAVADSGSQVSGLAKVGLSQLYTGMGRTNEAKSILESLVAHPTSLVSKEQATVLLASVIQPSDPKRAKSLLDGLKGASDRRAVSAAVEQSDSPTR